MTEVLRIAKNLIGRARLEGICTLYLEQVARTYGAETPTAARRADLRETGSPPGTNRRARP
jgi:hypothetical protein